MIRYRLLNPADYRRMPWRNGGGRTTELASYPPSAELDAFGWRISIADVERDGPFSRFVGIDRIIVLLQGDGMRLAAPDGAVELRERFDPHVFSGETAIDCQLLGGPVRDFNVMFRRGHYHGDVAVVQRETGKIAPAKVWFCFVVSGAVRCVLPDEHAVDLATDQSLLVEPGIGMGAMNVTPQSVDTAVLVVRIESEP